MKFFGRESGFGKKRLDGGLGNRDFFATRANSIAAHQLRPSRGVLVVADQRAVRSSWRRTRRRKEKSAEGSSFTPDRAACPTATFVLYQRLM